MADDASSDTDGSDSRGVGAYNIDRARGVLTPADREFIYSLDDPSEDPDLEYSRRRTREHRIRQRIRHSLIDWAILSGLESRRFESVFDDLRDCKNVVEALSADEELAEGLFGLFELLFRNLGSPNSPRSMFSTALSTGVSDAIVEMYAEAGYSVIPQPAVALNVGDIVPLDDVEQEFREGSGMTYDELHALWMGDRISMGEYNRAQSEFPEAREELERNYTEAIDSRRPEVAVDLSPEDIFNDRGAD